MFSGLFLLFFNVFLSLAKIVKECVQEFERLIDRMEILDDERCEHHGKRISKHGRDGSMWTSRRWAEKIRGFAGFSRRKVDRSSSTTAGYSFGNQCQMDEINFDNDNSVELTISCSPTQPSFQQTVKMAGNNDTGIHVVKHYFPSSIISWIEDPSTSIHVSHVTTPEQEYKYSEPFPQEGSTSNSTLDMHLSARLMDEFMELAKENTANNIETCGILGAFLKNDTFYVTTLIVPKQESSSNSCQALSEEEMHAILDEQSLFPAGWIHTHPSQTCFLSSVDLHTQFSYQVMLPEAIAIVMAPTDPMRNYGIFRLTNPGGINVLKECNDRGFHTHTETADGSPIYESCNNIFFNSSLRFEIIDLR